MSRPKVPNVLLVRYPSQSFRVVAPKGLCEGILPGTPYFAVGYEAADGSIIILDPRAIIVHVATGETIYHGRTRMTEVGFSPEMRQWLMAHPEW